MPARALPRGAYLGRPRHWLVDVTYAGQTWRVSDVPLEVTTAGGEVLTYHPGLGPLSVTEEIALGAETVSANTASVEAELPCDVPRLVALGHRLTGAWVEVSRYVEDTDYEARVPLVSGRPKEAVYDVASGRVVLSLDQAPLDDLSEMPPLLAKVDLSTWPQTAYIASGDYAVPYPIIIGQPGRAPHLSRGYCAGSRVAWVNKARLNHECLLAGHAVAASQVILLSEEDADGVRMVVTTTTDDRGRIVATVAPDNPASDTTDSLGAAPLDVYYSGLESADFALGSAVIPAVADEVPLYVAWYDLTDPTAGGLVAERGETVRGAGDALSYLLSLSTQAVDRAAFEAVRGPLNAYKIDAAIDARVKVWTWIEQNITPLLPISLRLTPFGVGPVLWSLDPLADDALFELDADADAGIELSDAVEYEAEPVYNEVTLEYTYDRAQGRHLAHVTRASDWSAADPDTVAHPLARMSVASLRVEGQDTGVRPLNLASDVIYDKATAHMVTEHLVSAYALPRRLLSAVVPEDGWDWLPLGAAGRVVSADHRFDGQRAVLVAKEWGDDGSLGLRLRITERPAVDARSPQAGAA